MNNKFLMALSDEEILALVHNAPQSIQDAIVGRYDEECICFPSLIETRNFKIKVLKEWLKSQSATMENIRLSRAIVARKYKEYQDEQNAKSRAIKPKIRNAL